MTFRQIIYDSLHNHSLYKKELVYLVEPDDWSIRWDGKYICGELNRQKLIKSAISTSRHFLRDKILHFGSQLTLVSNNGIKHVHPSNKIVFTWFHFSPNDPGIRFIPELNTKTDIVHTSCEITKSKLINFGLKPDKIVVVPIGIDLNNFRPYHVKQIDSIRKLLKLPKNKLIIGSFQKDGVGWSGGFEPKYIKGPDIFCTVVERLSKEFDVHVLLTGPARGFIKHKLKQAGISFTHHNLKNYLNIVDFYNAIDLYLVSSRAEGGPKAITESMACGIPIVSTKVGMAPEVIKHGNNGLLSDIDDVDSLTNNCTQIFENKELREKLIHNALEDVKELSWERTVKQLYDKIYFGLVK
jgi:glycosyltransferase involved in cell wall biosynthesis